VFRRYDRDGMLARDVVTLASDTQSGEPLLAPVMRNGRRIVPSPSLATVREHANRELERLPAPLRSLTEHVEYPVEISAALRALAADVDRRLGL
jgi:nicotinate phosphoribosyltransferase